MALLLFDSSSTWDESPRCNDVNSARIMVLGDLCSGKTSIIRHWIDHDYQPIARWESSEDLYRFQRSILEIIEGVPGSVDLCDTFGCIHKNQECAHDHEGPLALNEYLLRLNKKFGYQGIKKTAITEVQVLEAASIDNSDYSALRSLQIIQADAFLLCYDLTSRESFKNLRTYFRRIQRISEAYGPCPIMVCGTKCDLITERKISAFEIKGLLQRFGLCAERDYMETSARDNVNVSRVLKSLLIKIEENKKDKRLALQSSNSSFTNFSFFDREATDNDFSMVKRSPRCIRYNELGIPEVELKDNDIYANCAEKSDSCQCEDSIAESGQYTENKSARRHNCKRIFQCKASQLKSKGSQNNLSSAFSNRHRSNNETHLIKIKSACTVS